MMFIKEGIRKKMICWFENGNNNISKNIQDVYLLSSQSSVNHGLKVYKKNFRRSVALYAMRKIIASTFTSREDVYIIQGETQYD